VLIVTARIVDEERFRMMKEKNPAQHILPTLVSHELRMAPRVSHRNAKMVVRATDIIGDSRLCTSKHENPGFPVATDVVLDKCWPRLWAINHHARQNTLRGTALCHRTGGVEEVHRRVLIAANIAKRDAGDTTAWDLLKIEGASTPGKYLYLISASPHQMNWPPRNKDLVFIDSRANKYLILFSCIE
jgi:hypothetical protein